MKAKRKKKQRERVKKWTKQSKSRWSNSNYRSNMIWLTRHSLKKMLSTSAT